MIVDTERGSVAVDRVGAGPDVVLLHSLALAGEMWRGPADHLSATFTVWSVDARGHGRTPWDGTAFGVDDMAEDLGATLDALDLGTVRLLGLSMGGNTAIMFAATHPERVAKLVLADTTASYGPDRQERWEERARAAQARPRQQQMKFQLDRWFSPTFVAERPDEAQRIADIFVRTDSAAHAAACRALGAFDGRHLLDRIAADTLVVVGSDDYATPSPMAKELAERIPRAAYREIPDVRHMSLVEHPPIWQEIAAHFR